MPLSDKLELKPNPPFDPLQDFVLIKPIPRGKTPGGLALPDGAQVGPDQGVVVSVGPGRTTEYGDLVKPGVSPGDVVYLIYSYAGPVDVTLDGEEYRIARARDLVARVPPRRMDGQAATLPIRPAEAAAA